MADETPPRRPAVPEPISDAKKHANKLVVLSSVAKPAQNAEESLLGEPDPSKGPPTLPAKSGEDGLIRPVGWTTRPGGTTTIIKLPPKTGVLPRLTSLAQKIGQAPPPLPEATKIAPKTGGEAIKRSAPIKLVEPAKPAASENDSIFASAATPPAPVAPPVTRRAVPPPLPVRIEKKTPEPVAPLRTTSNLSKSTPPVVAKPASTPEPHHVAHVPPLVPHDAPAPESELPAPGEKAPAAKTDDLTKADPMAQTSKLMPPPAIRRTSALQPAQQDLLPLPVTAQESPSPTGSIPRVDADKKHRLPPRATVSGRLIKPPEPSATPYVQPAPAAEVVAPVVAAAAAAVAASAAPATPSVDKATSRVTPPKVFPVTPAPPVKESPLAPAAVTLQPQRSSVTPPTIPLKPGTGMVKPPTIPLKPAPTFTALAPFVRNEPPVQFVHPHEDEVEGGEEEETVPAPSSRAARMRKRRLIGIIVFYVLLVALMPGLYFASLYISRETRVEGQIIPPQGMLLTKEAWIVTDFRDRATGVASDLASDRMIVVQDMQEKLGHVQRAQADVATREARIRLFKDQIQADNDEEMSLVKQAREAAQQVWDGPGANLEAEYQSRLGALNQAISDRAKANHLQYNPDPNYYSPEVWANEYRLALYQVPAGVDSIKERAWLDDQMKTWHDFTKKMDQQQNSLRDQATQLKLAPASKVADLKSQMDDLQQRIDSTIAEEEPLQAELEQAKNDLSAVQAKEAGLDAKPYAMLDALPEGFVSDRLAIQPNGRFSWREVEKGHKYGEGEKTHVLWIFARALRNDGRQYWAMHRFDVDQNSTTLLMIEPQSFVSTRAILRPDLSPDEQAQ